jgi:NADPH-dependent curcumin reductase CurA
MGARVIAIAGTDEKCRWLKEELECDFVFNYKSSTWRDDFERDVGYFDVYFDNVGGEIFDYMLARVKPHATIVCSGKSWTACRVTLLN